MQHNQKIIPEPKIIPDLEIIPIPAFEDNYIWLMHNGKHAIVVDPGDAAPVFNALQRANLSLSVILITHHHPDHIDGVAALLEKYPHAKIYAPKLEQYAFEHTPVGEPDVIYVQEFDLNFTVLDVSGHTIGHIAYYAEQADSNHLLFSGDVIFGAGCGRVPEGSYAPAYQSLQKLAALPKKTKVYCTHEYTLTNIQFALTLEPNNQALVERLSQTQKLRDLGRPSLPTTIAFELATNPYLRCNSHEIQTTLRAKNLDEFKIFFIIRKLKNNY
ncbi:MAG: hydroxyacylglutathione hydrolase [Methylotenera sp.]|nr:hydroxyacylglutathione hydrolase [Methylotenera sp.]